MYFTSLLEADPGFQVALINPNYTVPDLHQNVLDIRSTTFAGNTGINTKSSAGAVSVAGRAKAHIADSSFLRNSAVNGAGLQVGDDTVASLRNCSMRENMAKTGSVIVLDRASLVIEAGSFDRNEADYGAAVAIRTTSHVRVKGRVTFTANTAKVHGAGIYASLKDAGTLQCDPLMAARAFLVSFEAGSTVTFRDNHADEGGAAFFAHCVYPGQATMQLFQAAAAQCGDERVNTCTSATVTWEGATLVFDGNNRAGFGAIAGTQAVSLQQNAAVTPTEYSPGEVLASRLFLQDSFGQRVAKLSDKLPYDVLVQICKSSVCSQSNVVFSQSFFFQISGNVELRDDGKKVPWPVQSNSGERQFAPSLTLTHKISVPVDGITMNVVSLQLGRKRCPDGTFYNPNQMTCDPCLLTQYIINPDLDGTCDLCVRACLHVCVCVIRACLHVCVCVCDPCLLTQYIINRDLDGTCWCVFVCLRVCTATLVT